jgi:hypothetical protein
LSKLKCNSNFKLYCVCLKNQHQFICFQISHISQLSDTFIFASQIHVCTFVILQSYFIKRTLKTTLFTFYFLANIKNKSGCSSHSIFGLLCTPLAPSVHRFKSGVWFSVLLLCAKSWKISYTFRLTVLFSDGINHFHKIYFQIKTVVRLCFYYIICIYFHNLEYILSV